MEAGSILRRLQQLDTCAVSDAVDRLKLPPAVSGIPCRTGRFRIAGRVVTVKLGPADVAVASKRHLCTEAIESASAGDVILVEQATGIEAAGWGGVLSNAARKRGLAGAIIEGPARDIDEAADLAFPVFSRSVTPRTARGRVQELATAVSLQIGGLTVEHHDFVVADSTGMVFIPAAAIERVLEVAEEVAAREVAMTRDLNEGRPVSQVMGASYENMLKSRP